MTILPIDPLSNMSVLTPNRFSELSEATTHLELLSAISIMANHLSQIRGQWVAWASGNFGFITSSDSVLTEQLDEVLEDLLTIQTSFSNAFKTYGKVIFIFFKLFATYNDLYYRKLPLRTINIFSY